MESIDDFFTSELIFLIIIGILTIALIFFITLFCLSKKEEKKSNVSQQRRTYTEEEEVKIIQIDSSGNPMPSVSLDELMALEDSLLEMQNREWKNGDLENEEELVEVIEEKQEIEETIELPKIAEEEIKELDASADIELPEEKIDLAFNALPSEDTDINSDLDFPEPEEEIEDTEIFDFPDFDDYSLDDESTKQLQTVVMDEASSYIKDIMKSDQDI